MHEERRVRAGRATLAAATLLALACAGSALAGGVFALGAGTIAGGGVSHARGGCFDLSGTVGEPAAGVVSGGGYVLVSGFQAAQAARADQLLRAGFEGCTR
jgi:hypothetical protein